VQVEIDKAVQQEAAQGRNSTRVDGTREMTLFCLEASASFAKQYPQKRDGAQASKGPGLGEQFHIVVMNMINDQAVVKNFVTWVYGYKRA
jgi:hypothetical protein